MTQNILISYSTRPVEGLEYDDRDVSAPANYKSPEAIEKWKAERKANFLVAAANQPYTGTFTEIRVASPGMTKLHLFKDDAAKLPPAQKAADVIAEYVAKFAAKNPDGRTLLIGFDMRDFLKIMGTECSLPGRTPIDPDLWIANGDHRDVAELVKPKEYQLTWPMVLKARNLDESFSDWRGPHENAEKDLMLITELATQLGLIGKSA